MKRQVEDASEVLPSQRPPATKIPKGEAQQEAARQPQTGGAGPDADRWGETGAPALPAEPCTALPEPEEDARFRSLTESWEKAKFRLRSLEGHCDIVTCVVAVDNLVISGSRDTTVKVWHVPTATEQRNLGGHTGGVTCLCAPPPDYCRRLAGTLGLAEEERFILSGAVDCCVRVWALNTGQCVKSIYTFNAVTALCFVPEGYGYIITGSDGGKVQAWSWQSLDNCQSVNAHQDAVTSIQSQGPLVFSGSTEGSVCVWESRCSERDPLRRLHHWDATVTGCGGQLTLSPRGDRLFLAYGTSNLRILDWRTGTVSKLTNHISSAGVTDCVRQVGGVLISSCYDLASGHSALNLFSLPQCRYLTSLTCEDAPRILCFAAWSTASGGHRWVTGGRGLTVWEELPSSGKQKGDVTARRDSRLEDCLMESDGDTEEEEDSDDDDNDDEDMSPGTSAGAASPWFRCVLQ